MRWQDIEGRWWTQPTNKADRVHRVYLAPTVRRVLDDLGPSTGLVFPNHKGQPFRDISTDAIKDIRKATGIADFHGHMLRHTVATHMSRIKIKKEHRSKVLNHSEGGTTKQYDHYDFDDEKKAALLKLHRHLCGIIEV